VGSEVLTTHSLPGGQFVADEHIDGLLVQKQLQRNQLTRLCHNEQPGVRRGCHSQVLHGWIVVTFTPVVGSITTWGR